MSRALFTTAILAVALAISGCRIASSPPPASAPQVRTVSIAARTAVKLVLLDELTSGGSEKGMTVRVALAEPIESLPAMTPGTATVAWSRTEGTLGGLTNRPARLTLTLQSLTAPDGTEIALSADPTEARDYELNRANTGLPDSGDPGEENAAAQQAVQELIQRGQSNGLDAKEVSDLARRMGMSETAKLADAGRLGEAESLIRTVRRGGSVTALAGGAPIAAALELVQLAGGVGQRLGRSLGGRNIRAYPGTIIPAYISRDAIVTVR